MRPEPKSTMRAIAVTLFVGLLFMAASPLLGDRQTNAAMVMLGLFPLVGLAVWYVWRFEP